MPFLVATMSTPTSKLLVGTPVISKSRRIVLSSPSQDSLDSGSEWSWAKFEGIADAEGSSSLDGVSVVELGPCVPEAGSEVEGDSPGASSFSLLQNSSNAT